MAVFDRGPLALGVVALPRIILEFALLAEVSSANPSEERVRTAGCALRSTYNTEYAWAGRLNVVPIVAWE